MHELILVMLLLINGSDGRIQTYGPITDGVVGPVMTWDSHTACTEYGDELLVRDTKLDGYICVVRPALRHTI